MDCRAINCSTHADLRGFCAIHMLAFCTIQNVMWILCLTCACRMCLRNYWLEQNEIAEIPLITGLFPRYFLPSRGGEIFLVSVYKKSAYLLTEN